MTCFTLSNVENKDSCSGLYISKLKAWAASFSEMFVSELMLIIGNLFFLVGKKFFRKL